MAIRIRKGYVYPCPERVPVKVEFEKSVLLSVLDEFKLRPQMYLTISEHIQLFHFSNTFFSCFGTICFPSAVNTVVFIVVPGVEKGLCFLFVK